MSITLPFIAHRVPTSPDCCIDKPHGLHLIPDAMHDAGIITETICQGRDPVLTPGDVCWCCLLRDAVGLVVCGHRTPMMVVPMCEVCRTQGHETRALHNMQAHEHPGQEQYI